MNVLTINNLIFFFLFCQNIFRNHFIIFLRIRLAISAYFLRGILLKQYTVFSPGLPAQWTDPVCWEARIVFSYILRELYNCAAKQEILFDG